MKTTVLYVEDEEDFQILVHKILTRAGMKVLVADNAQQAYRLMARENPDLMLLDINLPDATGYDICRRIRRDPQWLELPIVMLTVRRRPDEWLHGFSCGANDYLSKPIQPKVLVDRLLHNLALGSWIPVREQSAEYKLVRAIVNGNRTAYQVLVEKYQKRLFESLSHLIRNDVQLEDVVSHAFAAALDGLQEFRGESSFFTWLYRIALNEFMASCRKPLGLPLDAVLGKQEEKIIRPWESSWDEETRSHHERASHDALSSLDSLQPPYRETLALYCLKDLSYEKIARKLRIPEGTVMSRLHKARKLFLQAWAKTHSAPKD